VTYSKPLDVILCDR